MSDAATDRIVGFLARVPLLHHMEPKLLAVLAGIMKLTRQPAGTLLCEEGGPGDACFVIGHGTVDVIIGSGSDARVVATLGAGNVIGEVALIDGKKRSATVRCKSDVSVFTLRREDFEQLMWAGNPASMRLMDNIARDLTGRVRTVNERFAAIFSDAGQTISELTGRLEQLRSETEFVEGDADVGDDEDLLALVGYQATPSSR